MDVKNLLIGVKALLVDSSNWTQNTNARVSFGSQADEVEPWDPRATRWCLYGACAWVTGIPSWTRIADEAPEYSHAISALQHVANLESGSRDPLYVNDVLGHEAMLALLDKTIAHVEAEPERYALPDWDSVPRDLAENHDKYLT